LCSAWDAEVAEAAEAVDNGAGKKGKKRTPSLLRAIRRTYGTGFMLAGLALFVEQIIILIQPLFVGWLVRYFRYDRPLSERDAYLCAGGIVFCSFIYPVIHHPYFYYIQKCGMRMKMATSALIFDKVR
jgi:ATP-binding cassette subfamily C (CFTR/MRP) protein 4